MSEQPYPSAEERLRGNIRGELWAQRAIADLSLDESVIARLANRIADIIEYAIEVRSAPRWVKEGDPHRWTEHGRWR